MLYTTACKSISNILKRRKRKKIIMDEIWSNLLED